MVLWERISQQTVEKDEVYKEKKDSEAGLGRYYPFNPEKTLGTGANSTERFFQNDKARKRSRVLTRKLPHSLLLQGGADGWRRREKKPWLEQGGSRRRSGRTPTLKWGSSVSACGD